MADYSTTYAEILGYFDVAIAALEVFSPEDKKVDPKPPTIILGPGKRPPPEFPDSSPKLKRMKTEAQRQEATEEIICSKAIASGEVFEAAL